MLKVILSDGSVIENCLEGTTSDHIVAYGDTASDAAKAMDIINEDNSKVIRVEDEDGKEVVTGADLVLLPGASLNTSGDGFQCTINLRHKTEDEKTREEIVELQEAIIEL